MPRSWALDGLDILLHIDSFCLGDTLCISSFLDAFSERYKPKKIIVSTFWPELFSSDKFEFVSATSDVSIEVDKLVNIGFMKDEISHIKNGMVWGARDSMGLSHDMPLGSPPVAKIEREKKKKICIATESLKNIAKWIRPNGWGSVVSALIKMGYEVHNISYEKEEEIEGVIYHSGNEDIMADVEHIAESEVFVGLSSGLSWLAWAYDTPVVMISGFTKEYNEFPCYRVMNERACNGCFNVFKSIKNQCPIFISTPRQNECHMEITPEMVIEKIKMAIFIQSENLKKPTSLGVGFFSSEDI